MRVAGWRKFKTFALFLGIALGAPCISRAQTTYTEVPLGTSPAPGGISLQASDGNYYGTTYGGGSGFGTVFRLTPQGTFTTIYSFCSLAACVDGANPEGGLMEGADGNLYGITYGGGNTTNCFSYTGCGTIYRISLTGDFTSVYSFCVDGTTNGYQPNCPDGYNPTGSLIPGSDGDFYGIGFKFSPTQGITEINGGPWLQASDGNYYSVVYDKIVELTSTGAIGTIYTFSPPPSPDFYTPALVEGADGALYAVYGDFFKITTSGQYTSLANADTDTGLLLAGDGNFYYGTITQATPSGQLNSVAEDGGPTLTGDGNFVLTGDYYYILKPSPAIPPVVQLAFGSINPAVNQADTLTWKVLNGYSLTLQQCNAFIMNNAANAGTWSGPQKGSMVSGVYTGTASITPTASGVYGYSLNCGGTETGFAWIRVGSAKAATTAVLTSNSPATLGTTLTLNAQVYSPQPVAGLTGSVTFSVGSLNLGSVPLVNGTVPVIDGIANLTLETSAIPPGTYPVTVAYPGDQNFQASSSTLNVTVLGYATATALKVSPATLKQGQTVTLSSTVSRTAVGGIPTGSVTFYYGTFELGTAKLNGGTASLAIALPDSIDPGLYAITAKYAGDTSDQASASGPVNLDILATTSTSLTVTPNPAPTNSTIQMVAKVKRVYGSTIPTGNVTFDVSGYLVSVALDGSGTATLNLSDVGVPPGSYGITASYSGDSLDASSSSANVPETID